MSIVYVYDRDSFICLSLCCVRAFSAVSQFQFLLLSPALAGVAAPLSSPSHSTSQLPGHKYKI